MLVTSVHNPGQGVWVYKRLLCCLLINNSLQTGELVGWTIFDTPGGLLGRFKANQRAAVGVSRVGEEVPTAHLSLLENCGYLEKPQTRMFVMP